MSEDIKKCKVCGRTITDKNNITGLCPKHQRALNDGATVVGIGAIALGLKKFGPKILKGAVKLIKR